MADLTPDEIDQYQRRWLDEEPEPTLEDLIRSAEASDDIASDADEVAARELARVLSAKSREALVMEGSVWGILEAQPLEKPVPVQLWLIDERETVDQIHMWFCSAGAQIAIADTTPFSTKELARESISVDQARAIATLVGSARSAGPRFIMGQLSPSAEPTHARALPGYTDLARMLAQAGVHGFLVAPMASAADALTAVQAIREVSDRSIAVVLSVGANGVLRGSNETIADAISTIAAVGVGAVGIECDDIEVAAQLAPVLVAAARANDVRPLLRTDILGVRAVEAPPGADTHASECLSRIVQSGITLIGPGACAGVVDHSLIDEALFTV